MNTRAEHVREHRSILAAAEKRLLVRIARQLPRWVGSDHLSVLGIASMLAAGLAYGAARWDARALYVVVAALALNWLGDSLDGTVARVRNCQRPRYGYYVDHVLDLFGVVFLLGGLAVSGYMNPLVALGTLASCLLLMAESFLAAHAVGVFRLSSLRVGPTELRILLAIGTLALVGEPRVQVPGWGAVGLFDFGGVIAIAVMNLALLGSAVRNTRDLHRAEPLPRVTEIRT